MDQKSSLIDPSLKIYPSEKLIKFIQTIRNDYEIPENILKFMKTQPNKENKIKLKKTNHNHHFSDADISNLDKIKAAMKKLEHDKPEEKSATNTENDKNIHIMLKTPAQEKEDDSGDKQIKAAMKKLEHDEPKEKSVANNENDKNIDNMLKTPAQEKEDGSGDKKRQLETDTPEVEKLPQEKERGPFLQTSDLDWLYVYLNTIRSTEKDTPYLHELIEGIHIEMPENSVIKRNPVLEERCVKLRAQQEARDYRKMTKGVDNVRIRFPDDSISFQLKQLNRQLIAIGQFIISIFAGFLFGFRGVEWMVGNLDFGFRLLLGVMCALVIALAEIYFLAKKLNEELNVPETTQIGGPPKFVDEEKYGSQKKVKSVGNKEHQD